MLRDKEVYLVVNDALKAETRFSQVSIMELNKLNFLLSLVSARNDVKIHRLRLWWRKECKGYLDYRLHGIRGKGSKTMIQGFIRNRRSQYCTANCEGNRRERLTRDTGGRLSGSSDEVRESVKSEGLSLFGYQKIYKPQRDDRLF
jgi:hypothetical protein